MIDTVFAFLGLTTTRHAEFRFSDGIQTERNRQRETREKIQLDQLRGLMNKPVICISNEWENPLIGTVVDIEFITQAKNPVPIVRCAITGKDILTLSKVMPFTMQRFEALMKLNPYERWCLIDNQSEVEYRTTDKRQLPKLYTRDEYVTVLMRKNFLQCVETVAT